MQMHLSNNSAHLKIIILLQTIIIVAVSNRAWMV